MQELTGIQPPNLNGGLDDLESFQTCIEKIQSHFQASQSSMKEKHRALRVLQAKKERTNFTEKTHQLQPTDEHKTTEADKLQIENEERKFGCLLVQKTKGETQLQVSRWLSTANSGEAWRQLNLQCTTSKWNISFQLLASIMNTNFDTQPASFLHQLNAWKEQVVRYQKLSREQLPDFIKLTALVNGLKGSVRNFVLLNLHDDSSFGDLDSMLVAYLNNLHDPHGSSLDSLRDRACRVKPEEFKQQLEEGGKRKEGKGKRKSKPNKGKGEAYPPQPPAYKGKGKQAHLPTREQWCSICWKKGTEPKLAGGTSSINSSTYSNKLGTIQASSSIGLQKLQRRDLKSSLQDRQASSLQQLGLRQSTRE